MNAWWLLFTIAMLLSPVVFALTVRQADDPDANPVKATRMTLWLFIATLAAIGVTLLVWQTLGVPAQVQPPSV